MFEKSVRSICCAISLIIALSLASTALAEEKGDESIFKYKKELAITDKQESNLRAIISKIQDTLKEKTEELNKLRAELNKMIVDKADLDKIKTKLRTIGRIQADATYEDIASIRAIENELTAAQMTQWRGMQEKFRKKMQQNQTTAPKQKGVTQ
jgi:DNA repair ATPase RecN